MAILSTMSGSSEIITSSVTHNKETLDITLNVGSGSLQGSIAPRGKDGNGILKIEKTKTVGLVDTYTIFYTDGNTTTFNVTNGEVSAAQLKAVSDRVQALENGEYLVVEK